MPINLDPLNQLSMQYYKESWERFMAHLEAKSAVKSGVSCVKCHSRFVYIGPLGIVCNCDCLRPIQETFSYADEH